MTDSELQCTNVLVDYFFKEFVYKNLYVYDGKQKKELCDGLVEFQDTYVIFQIKEKDGSKAIDWIQKKVYKKAVSQIKDTIAMIRNLGEIEVESFSGKKIALDPTMKIMPVIIFDSDDNDYKQVHVSSQDNALRINVFSMNDFVKVLDGIAIPHDIISYLELRSSFFESSFPSLLINNISENMTSLAKIENEEGFLDYYIAITNGNKFIDSKAIKGFQFVINSFKERLMDDKIYDKEEYKEILKCLLRSNRNTVQDFMLRWQICVNHCMKKEETRHHFLIDTSNKLGYLYLTQTVLTEEKEYVRFLVHLFKYKFKLVTVVGVLFNQLNEEDYTVEWIMISSENVYNEQFEQILEKEKPWSNIKQLKI